MGSPGACAAERLVVPGVGAFGDCIDEGAHARLRRSHSRVHAGPAAARHLRRHADAEAGGIWQRDSASCGPHHRRAVAHHFGPAAAVAAHRLDHLVPSKIRRSSDDACFSSFADASRRVLRAFVRRRPADTRDVLADTLYSSHRVCAAVARKEGRCRAGRDDRRRGCPRDVARISGAGAGERECTKYTAERGLSNFESDVLSHTPEIFRKGAK